MTVIESKVSVDKSVSEVYNFLADLNNHQQLMPDTIYNWSSTENEAKFTIQNMAKLALKVESKIKDKEIIAAPSEPAPFAIELKWTLNELGNKKTEAIYTIAADLNMMLKMLAAGPLQKLADHQTSALKKVLKG
jgi:hypothetical protein